MTRVYTVDDHFARPVEERRLVRAWCEGTEVIDYVWVTDLIFYDDGEVRALQFRGDGTTQVVIRTLRPPAGYPPFPWPEVER